MQGIEAINAHNGWAMAVTGACIVMTGLTTLSIIISQLHKIVGLFEQKEVAPPAPEPAVQPALGIDPKAILDDLELSAKAFQACSAQLGATFPLQSLYKLLAAKGDPHPHITVRELREASLLVPAGEGHFEWRSV